MDSQNGSLVQKRKKLHDAPESSDGSNEGQSPHVVRQRGNTRPHSFKACNDCRQQKLRCDVVGEPGRTVDPERACSRCKKHKLHCKIEVDFKRIKKKGKYEELQREVEELKRKLAEREIQEKRSKDQFGIQNEGPLVEIGYILPSSQRLEDVELSSERVKSLFHEFLTAYNPSLPLLDPRVEIDHHFNTSPLLGWTIMLIASRRSRFEPTLLEALTGPFNKLLWATISTMPHSYHIVKALCLLCSWPLPAHNSSVDPNFLLSGIMMQVALQAGLHRPAHARDFGRSITSISDAEVKDRTWAWIACNVVVQRTTYSYPTRSVYDWTLGSNLANKRESLNLPEDLLLHLQIEKFCDKVSRTLYQNSGDRLGILSEVEQVSSLSILREEYRDLEVSLTNQLTGWNKAYFLAAGLHLEAFAFFIPRTSAAHSSVLLHAYNIATLYIQSVLEFEANTSAFLRYCSSPLQHAFTSACCILLKLLNSSFSVHLDVTQGKTLFNSGVLALRTMSINANDLSSRTAEALSRMWCAASSAEDNQVELIIRTRMSTSHMVDCMWRWKKGFEPQPAISNTTGVSPQAGATGFQPVFDDFNALSGLQDNDLFNTLDWVFDEDGNLG